MHLSALKMWKELRPGDAPDVGDRIPYVITRGGDDKFSRAEKKGSRARPPWTVNARDIDTVYYLENKMKKPFLKVLSTFLSPQRCRNLFRVAAYAHESGSGASSKRVRPVVNTSEDPGEVALAAARAAVEADLTKPRKQATMRDFFGAVKSKQ